MNKHIPSSVLLGAICALALEGCALPPTNLDGNLNGAIATRALAGKSEFKTLGIHKVALVVNELPQVTFDYFGRFFGADPTDHYEVPQSELVPEGYLRDQMVAAMSKQSEVSVLDKSELSEEFVASVQRVPWRDVYAVAADTPAYAVLQSMHNEGIEAVLFVNERNENGFRFGNFLNHGGFELGPKGICNCPPGNDPNELLAYASLFAVIISTTDGKEVDDRDYIQGSSDPKPLEWQTAFEKYSPQDIVIMRDAIEERERVNAEQILRAFKILPPATPSN